MRRPDLKRILEVTMTEFEPRDWAVGSHGTVNLKPRFANIGILKNMDLDI
ncbi:hypothetical protein B4135_1731 [Caldibacillus debilis]|uniref:Uncharacterized protein n=1 Tax=Caldibacillus debilis TaxID=301148 RepID=A0A150M8Y7_9BACI|nr:hypothetical protein B4135_1731 [Caldibacillus debilis]